MTGLRDEEQIVCCHYFVCVVLVRMSVADIGCLLLCLVVSLFFLSPLPLP
jgi:hypothetical protein